MIIEKIRLAFSMPKPRDQFVSREKEHTRRIVSARSHGDIRLQQGKYYTDKDVDAQYEQLKDKRFCDVA